MVFSDDRPPRPKPRRTLVGWWPKRRPARKRRPALKKDTYVPPKPEDPEFVEPVLASMEGERVVLSPDGADDPPGRDPDAPAPVSKGPWYSHLFPGVPRWLLGTALGTALVAVLAAGVLGSTGATSESESTPADRKSELGPSEAGTSDAGTPLSFSGSALQLATIDAIAGAFGGDSDSIASCLELEFLPSDAEVEAMADPDVSTWPGGLAELYAEVLEGCRPLEPYYLDLFRQFDFSDPACPRVMTNNVLQSYSWLRFLEKGILDPDLRVQIQAEFDAFVLLRYDATQCYAES